MERFDEDLNRAIRKAHLMSNLLGLTSTCANRVTADTNLQGHRRYMMTVIGLK